MAVLGAGSWGTALAMLLARNGHRVTLWGRDSERVVEMRSRRANERYLPGHHFPEGLALCTRAEECLEGADLVLLAVPSRAFSEVLTLAAETHPPRIVWATKGFEPGSDRLLHEVVEEAVGPATVRSVLSGPTFAGEVAAGLPAAVTLGCAQADGGAEVAGAFHCETFRVYTTGDLVGVEVGGAVKNVLAIAAGVSDGLGFGANARAALVTRGLAELIRLGSALGARAETLMGLAGLGDLVLTCTDDQSRNRRFGLALARGSTPAEAEAALGQVVEGRPAAAATARLARRLGVEMPIAEQVHQLVEGATSPDEAVRCLLARQARPEGP